MQDNVAEVSVLSHHVEGLQRASVVLVVLKNQAGNARHLGLAILLQLFHHRHLVSV